MLPLAVASHFALDALPHYGGLKHTSRQFLVSLGVDIVLAGAILLFLAVYQPQNWFLMVSCGIAAASPDLQWLAPFLHELMSGKPAKIAHDPITRFHQKIQWGERPWGIWVEVIWFSVMLTLLTAKILF